MNKILAFIALALVAHTLQAQPVLSWQKSYGGSGHEYAWKTIPTSDGGYAFVGFSESTNGDLSGHHGTSANNDLWVCKTNAAGTIQWSKLFGGSEDDEGHDIIQTADSGFMVAGWTDSFDGDVTGHHGTYGSDMWVLKITSAGALSWAECYGGTDDDAAAAMVRTPGGDFYVAGSTYSDDGDVSGNHGSSEDFWVIKISSSGTLLYQKCIGGTDYDEGINMALTADNGCVVCGRTSSSDGDAIGYHSGSDMLIAKLSASLSLEWSKCFGGSETEECNAIVQLGDGSYAALGYTSTQNNGDVSGHHGSQGSDDFWLVKISALGLFTSAACYGGSGDDQANGLALANDGGFFMCGLTNSTDGDVSGFHSSGFFDPDVWVAKIHSSGTLQWQRCCGGSGQDESFHVYEEIPGVCVVTGFTYSGDNDVTVNYGSADGWIIKVSGAAAIGEVSTDHFEIFPNPFSDAITLKLSDKASEVKKIEICDVLGNSMKIIENISPVTEYKIETGDLPAGVYFLAISGTDFRETMKILRKGF